MTKEELVALGLSEEQAAEVATKALAPMRQQLDSLKAGSGDAKALRSKIAELEADLERRQALAEQNYSAALDVDRKKFTAEIQAAKERAEQAEKQLTSLRVTGSLQSAATAAGVDPTYMDAVSALLAPRVTIEGDQVVLDGKPIKDALASWVATDDGKRFAAGPKNRGAGTNPADVGAPESNKQKRSEMNRMEKIEFIAKHGQAAYESLPY